MENDKDNITIGRPKVGGAIYWAPLGSTLPTDATTSLSDEFVNLGYVTEDGVNIPTTESINEVKAWGPETVMIAQDDFSVTVGFNLLETIRPDVQRFVRGESNVAGESDGSLKSALTGEQLPRGILVVETIQNNGTTPREHRIVFGDCQVVDRSGDENYNNSDPVTYPISVRAFKFDSQAISGKKVYRDDFWAEEPPVSA